MEKAPEAVVWMLEQGGNLIFATRPPNRIPFFDVLAVSVESDVVVDGLSPAQMSVN